jgi:alpha-amylase
VANYGCFELQVLTDRFAKTDSSSTTACSDLSNYCGGTWAGMESNLDYIQGMGFDAIWITPVVESEFLRSRVPIEPK